MPYLAIDRASIERIETLYPSATVSAEVRPGNAVYIIFTLGSTGEPKGIVVEHRALCTSVREQYRLIGITPKLRLL